jgi:ectoine hydroxylase-related dioxygenase (phytanoyl-CoA dioxygenase family)
MISLTDVEEIKHGLTKIVPRSHLSGQIPSREVVAPTYNGKGPHSAFARAGDVHILNSQIWHRGSQNNSERDRYLITMTFGKRFIDQRFYPFLNYVIPRHVLDVQRTNN